MMQFTEAAPFIPPSHGQNGLGMCLDVVGTTTNRSCRGRPWPGFPTSSKSFGSFNNANCMEQLLVQCANAIESNDATLAQQILWVLYNIAPPDGDSNQRLTSGFLRALITRASKTGSFKILTEVARATADLAIPTHTFTAVSLASFVDLTPWHRFGFSAANAAIVDAVEGFSVIHIVDFSTTLCMQIPTLIDSLANRSEGPLFIRLTVPGPAANTAPGPILEISYDELGMRLINFARSRNIGMEFKVIPSSPSDGFDALIEQVRLQQLVSEGEALVVNCQMMLHYIPEETATGAISAMNVTSPICSLRMMFLKSLRSLNPVIVTVIDEDAEFTGNDLVGRLRSAFNYLWIRYDAVDTFLPRGSEQRRWYEADVGWKIENVVACEGLQRVERQESRSRWVQRMRNAGFRGVGFGEEAVAEVKSLLEEHAAGWGLKKEGEDDLVLTWKGHNAVFATAWLPSSS